MSKHMMIIDKEGNLTPINDDRLAKMQIRLLAAILHTLNGAIDGEGGYQELIEQARELAGKNSSSTETPSS